MDSPGPVRAEMFGWWAAVGWKCAVVSDELLSDKVDDYEDHASLDFCAVGGCCVEGSLGS